MIETVRGGGNRISPKIVIRFYYGFQFFFSLLIWLPIFYEYQRRLGLSETQIFTIQSIYYLSFCILEIPTGLLADRWGHLNCLRLGSITLVVANFLPVFLPDYDGFLWHFLLLALSRSLVSGASSAYLYNYFMKYGKPDHFKQIEGNARAYGLIGKVVCWAAVGFLMQWHMTLPYTLSGLAAGFSGVFAWLLPNFVLTETEAGAKSKSFDFLIQFVPVLKMLSHNFYVLLIMVQGVAVFVLSRICQVNLFQPLLTIKAFGMTSFGTVMSVMTLFEAFGSAHPNIFRKWLSDLNSVFILTAITAFSLGMLVWSGKVGTIAWLCVFSLVTGFCFPIQRQLLNDVIPDSRYRATILSIESILDRAICAWVASLLGVFVASGRTLNFIGDSAFVSAIIILALFLWVRSMKLTRT
jgi:MFS family permease